jgi:hypothetical protein
VNEEEGWSTADEAKLEGMVLSRRHNNPAQEVEISCDKLMSNSKDTLEEERPPIYQARPCFQHFVTTRTRGFPRSIGIVPQDQTIHGITHRS